VSIDLVKEITIKASPETIFPYLIESDQLVRWMGTEATLVAKPHGEYRVLCSGVNPAAGEFVAVEPNERVVFTFGWDVDNHPIPAGSSEVEITLTRDGEFTLLRLTHRGLPEDANSDHAQGWTYYLDRLQQVLSGEDPGPDAPNFS
jgi:uncharacterized protein YndB with AHSA1/START domain